MPVIAARRRFTVDEYHRMARAGILGVKDRVELIEGEIIARSPIGDAHAACVRRLIWILPRLFGDRAIVDAQNPVRLGSYDGPQPDLAILRPRRDLYADGHPGVGDVFFLIEVSDTTLAYDRDEKLPRYAAAGIPEVWIVDLVADRIEVYRNPSGRGYGDCRRIGRGERVGPAAVAGCDLPVEEILGPA